MFVCLLGEKLASLLRKKRARPIKGRRGIRNLPIRRPQVQVSPWAQLFERRLNVNQGFFFFLSKAPSRMIFYIFLEYLIIKL